MTDRAMCRYSVVMGWVVTSKGLLILPPLRTGKPFVVDPDPSQYCIGGGCFISRFAIQILDEESTLLLVDVPASQRDQQAQRTSTEE